MRWAWILLLLAGCEDSRRADSVNADGVPKALEDELKFVEQTIQLQPDGNSPRFTMKVPSHWEHDRALDNGQRLVNGANEPYDEFESKTFWIDPEMHDGQFELDISCAGDCAAGVEAKIFDQWTDPVLNATILSDERTATDRMMIAKNDEGRIYVLRVWHVDGDTRFRACLAAVGKRFAKAYRAFAKACAGVVEQP